jgi:hypothetical protein
MRLSVLAVALVLLVPTGAAAGAVHCPGAGQPLVVGSESVLLVRGTDVVGCWRPLGRVRLVARGGIDFTRADAIRAAVSGRYAAVALRTHGPVGDQLFVYVMNLRTGRVHNAEANFIDTPAGVTAADVRRLVLAKDGSAAWTTNGGGLPTDSYHVETMDRRGKTWVVDDEPGIAPTFLRLRGVTLTWSVNGQRRSAELP